MPSRFSYLTGAGIRVAGVALVCAATPVVAQQPAPSVQQYLCTFAGKCDGAAAAPAAMRDAPETKGFRLARPSAAASPSPVPAPVAAAVPARAAMPRAQRQAPRYVSDAASTARANATYGLPAGRSAGAGTASFVATRAPVGAGSAPRANLLIGFELNSAQLTPEGRQSAQVFARSLLMPELRAMHFRIEGHTDLRGGAAINAGLSARRAQAVTDYLVSQGVDRSRLVARGYGASVPLPGRTAADPANRRVEAELIS